jgi:D-alanyl-D-alanine carboxypeptidase
MLKKTTTYFLITTLLLVGNFFVFKKLYHSKFYQENVNFQGALASAINNDSTDDSESSKKATATPEIASFQCPANSSDQLKLCDSGQNASTPQSPYPFRNIDSVEPEIQSEIGIALDSKSDAILFSKNSEKITSLASITKLMTALVFLDFNPGWDDVYTMKNEDRRDGGRIYLFTGDQVKIKDLFYLSLVASDNTATIALANTSGLSEEQFVEKMNEKAEQLGLANTKFKDAVGLSDENVSSAFEVAELAKAALANKEIREATMAKAYKFVTLGGRTNTVPSTDLLLKNLPPNGIKINGGKTGYTEQAGYCFVGNFSNNAESEIIAVILDSPTYQSRFDEAKKIAEWSFENYNWK